MENGTKKEISVRLSHDDMEAYLRLPVLEKNEYYTKSDVMVALEKAKVKVGIDESVIDEMLATEYYGKERLVAKGTPCVDGTDAYYEYMFNTNLDKKPKIRADGTVDYWTINAIETVEEGQVIAVYHEPVDGHHGMTVCGKLIMAKRGRPLPPLLGKGFEKSEDGKTYTSALTGKIDLVGGRIQILPVYEINGNVDLNTGNIEFRGDVLVHGNVTSGTFIKASGTVTIDGTAEACTIDAGKDVILRGGFLGGYKGVIRTKGNVYAKFIEYAKIEADGFLEADATISSDIFCRDKVFINGKHAVIVGGSVYGARGVEAFNFGNANEIHTSVRAGVLHDTIIEVEMLKKQLDEDNKVIAKINTGLQKFDEMAAARNIDVKNDERRVALLRARIAKQADVASATDRLAHLKELVESSKGATIKASQDVFPGVEVSIDDVRIRVKEPQHAVQYVLRDGQVVMFSVEGELVG